MLSLVIDTETTGVDPGRDRIIELGFILTDWKDVYGALRSYVNPEMPFDNAEYNGLTIKDVADAPTFAQLLPFTYTLLLYADEYIAHNWHFDRRFIQLELARAGLRLPSRPFFDTMRACGGRKLQEACERYNVKHDDIKFHSALQDALATLRLCTKLRPGGPNEEVGGRGIISLVPRW